MRTLPLHYELSLSLWPITRLLNAPEMLVKKYTIPHQHFPSDTAALKYSIFKVMLTCGNIADIAVVSIAPEQDLPGPVQGEHCLTSNIS